MLLELYILYSIVGFTAFFIALLIDKGFYNMFIWPIAILMFSMLIFTSYNIIAYTRSYIYPELSWVYIGLTFLSILLLAWDVFDKFTNLEF